MGEIINLTNCDDGTLHFYADVTEVSEASLSFKIYEVESHINDKPEDVVYYASGSMSWDGYINIDYHPDGCIKHYCGRRGVRQHCEMMGQLIDKLGPLMAGFDKERAEF